MFRVIGRRRGDLSVMSFACIGPSRRGGVAPQCAHMGDGVHAIVCGCRSHTGGVAIAFLEVRNERLEVVARHGRNDLSNDRIARCDFGLRSHFGCRDFLGRSFIVSGVYTPF